MHFAFQPGGIERRWNENCESHAGAKSESATRPNAGGRWTLRSRTARSVREHGSNGEPRRHDGCDGEPTKIEAHGRVRVPPWYLKKWVP